MQTLSSRGKGRRNENKAAKEFGGVRVSEAGLPGADIVDGLGNLVEVKYRKKLPKSLVDWITQRDEQGCEYLLIRQAYGKWQVVIDGELFRDKYLGLTGTETED